MTDLFLRLIKMIIAPLVLAALISGEVDFVFDPPYQDVARLKSEPSIALLQTTDLGEQYLTFDQAHPNGYMGNYLVTSPVNTKGSVKGLEVIAVERLAEAIEAA